MSDYITFEEAAEYLHTPHSTLYRWLREGKVPGHKLGRQWRFLRSELEVFRASGNRQSEERAALHRLAEHLKPEEKEGLPWTHRFQTTRISPRI